MKKKAQNGKRKNVRVQADSVAGVDEKATEATKEVEVDEATLKHLQTVLSMIEGRKVSREEILELVRQHSMVKQEKWPYSANDPEKDSG